MHGVKEKIVLFSGYAQLPAGTAASEMHKVMGIVVLVEMSTGKIIEADCTLSTRLAERFVSNILIGRSLKQGTAEINSHINDVYQGSAKRAIITILNIIHDKYMSYSEAANRSPYA